MSSLGFTSKEQRNLGLLVHLMTSNPKILYAPVGTEVDKVILKVRAQRLGPLPCRSHRPRSAGTSSPSRAVMPAGRWADASMAASCPGVTFPLPQANETFAFVGNVTHYANAWLNISPEIRAYLEEGRLQRRIRWLQQVGQGEGDPAWGWEGAVLPPGTSSFLHVKPSGGPGCPLCSCEDLA